MKRQMKLIRKILEYVEKEAEDRPVAVPEIVGYTESEIHYHVGLCHEANYLRVVTPTETPQGRRFLNGIVHLTWAGHDALDQLRTV